MRTPSHGRAALGGLLAATLALGGCAEGGYYAHSLYGGAKVLAKRQKIARLLEDPALDPALRERLTAAVEIRDFASRELGLPDNKSYRTYVDIGREAVSWTVTAAPEFSIAPVTWCFPVAGCVSYKGYFAPEKARAFADQMRADGYDVSSGGVSAYSTLGWFADPILSIFLTRSEIDLAGLIFHELAHQVVYVKDSTTFNESFATAVELEGVRRWVAARSVDEAATDRYRTSQRREGEFVDLVLRYRERLATLYESKIEPGAMRVEKQTIFGELDAALRQLRDDWNEPEALSGWIGAEINNAHLAGIGAYHASVPAFEALLERSGSLAAFYETVEELSELDPEVRDQRLTALAPEGAPRR